MQEKKIYLIGSSETTEVAKDILRKLEGQNITVEMKEQDLFEQWEMLPAHVLLILERMQNLQEKGAFFYAECEQYQKELEKIGYTYDYDLSGEPFNLRKL